MWPNTAIRARSAIADATGLAFKRFRASQWELFTWRIPKAVERCPDRVAVMQRRVGVGFLPAFRVLQLAAVFLRRKSVDGSSSAVRLSNTPSGFRISADSRFVLDQCDRFDCSRSTTTTTVTETPSTAVRRRCVKSAANYKHWPAQRRNSWRSAEAQRSTFADNDPA
ncbi:unnamed protein product [Heligmosomoides polygyrus]|uniref:Transposase n=1 Tax=Heligmosomoides polygyrus TaxID=6339 RepID=A0A183FFM0_HELPZ|nr:unnamed protein product [Heligmosomoides polygyrus]